MENITTWIGMLVLAAVLLVLGLSMGQARSSGRESQLAVVQQAIERAAVQCYALEGAYPPNVRYLEDRYGIVIDHSRYFVHYETYGANLPPDIIVFEEAVTP